MSVVGALQMQPVHRRMRRYIIGLKHYSESRLESIAWKSMTRLTRETRNVELSRPGGNHRILSSLLCTVFLVARTSPILYRTQRVQTDSSIGCIHGFRYSKGINIDREVTYGGSITTQNVGALALKHVVYDKLRDEPPPPNPLELAVSQAK